MVGQFQLKSQEAGPEPRALHEGHEKSSADNRIKIQPGGPDLGKY
jgi:hypothetical protein